MQNAAVGLEWPKVKLAGEQLDEMDRFSYLGNGISRGGHISDEVCSRMQHSRLAFAALRHLWRRRDIRLSARGLVYTAAVGSVLPHHSKTWPVRAEDMWGLLVFEHCYLRTVGGIWWEDFVCNSEARRKILSPRIKSLERALNHNRLIWLGPFAHAHRTAALLYAVPRGR